MRGAQAETDMHASTNGRHAIKSLCRVMERSTDGLLPTNCDKDDNGERIHWIRRFRNRIKAN